MRILFIAPLPPPVTGHSLASQTLLDELARTHDVDAIDLGSDSTHDGAVTGRRLVAVLKTIVAVASRRARADAIYLTISESVAGNLKDVAIYLVNAPSLSRVYVHLHGGSLKRLLFDRHAVLRRLNALFLKRVGGAIVSGQSHVGIFDGLLDRDRIHIVPNFAPDDLFVTRDAITAKFAQMRPLRVLYLSGMAKAKGYTDLADAFFALPEHRRRDLHVDFAGMFSSDDERTAFEERIRNVTGLAYHGIVTDAEKRSLFARAHVFCLPTTHLEGQPISVLEGYASGCVVMTTVPPGIRDIFTPSVNGFEIQPRSPASIVSELESVLAQPERLPAIALANNELATRAYRTSIYGDAVRSILESSGGRPEHVA